MDLAEFLYMWLGCNAVILFFLLVKTFILDDNSDKKVTFKHLKNSAGRRI